MWTLIFLTLSNVFMTIAWYGHLKFGNNKPLMAVILISWLIALLEYCFQVPANRMGYLRYGFSAGQLKIIQECITLVVFSVFSILVLKERLTWNVLVGFGLMFLAVFVVFYFKPAATGSGNHPELPAITSESKT